MSVPSSSIFQSTPTRPSIMPVSTASGLIARGPAIPMASRPHPNVNTPPTPTAAATRTAATEDMIPAINLENLSGFVKVIIGRHQYEIIVPASMLLFHSAFFRAACNERWRSGRDATVRLEEEEPETFGILLTWMYTGSIENSAYFPKLRNHTSDEERTASLMPRSDRLVQCFLLGQFLQIHAFQNAVADALVDTKHRTTQTIDGNIHPEISESGSRGIKRIWENTLPGSPLRNIILDELIANCGLNSPPVSFEPHLPCFTEYFYELSRHAIRLARGGTHPMYPWLKDPCTYHIHPGKPAEYSCTQF